MNPLADVFELVGAVRHMLVCLGRASWGGDEPVGCLSNDEIDRL